MNKFFKGSALLAIAALVMVTRPAFAQSATGSHSAQKQGILGYLDPQTGAFRAVVQGPGEDSLAPAAAPAPTTGKFVYSFTINIASSIPTTQQIVCSGTASTSETNTTTFQSRFFEEEATALATRSGATATCTVNIPYSWGLATAASDTVALGFSVTSAGTGTTANVLRLTDQSLPSIKVPANAATTTNTLKVTI